MTVEDEDLLMEVLNSAPVVDGRTVDALGASDGAEFARRLGGTGSRAELRHLVRIRDLLQDSIRGVPDSHARLGHALGDIGWTPSVDDNGIAWTMRGPADRLLPWRTALAWSRIAHDLPGRLRPCANSACNLFLIDHSKPGTAKWCSMATCGNRHKARAHADRRRGSREDDGAR